MFGITALAYFTAVNGHGLIALWIAADVIYTMAGTVAVGGIAVGRYIGRIRALHLRAFLLSISSRVNGRFIVREVGFFLSE